jgi:DNA modification methylase
MLDPFSGSGTTLIAAERTGRRARVSEIDHPPYVDVAVRRWQDLTGKAAVLDGGDLRFGDVEATVLAPA